MTSIDLSEDNKVEGEESAAAVDTEDLKAEGGALNGTIPREESLQVEVESTEDLKTEVGVLNGSVSRLEEDLPESTSEDCAHLADGTITREQVEQENVEDLKGESVLNGTISCEQKAEDLKAEAVLNGTISLGCEEKRLDVADDCAHLLNGTITCEESVQIQPEEFATSAHLLNSTIICEEKPQIERDNIHDLEVESVLNGTIVREDLNGTITVQEEQCDRSAGKEDRELEQEAVIVPKKGYDLSFLDKLDDLEHASPTALAKGCNNNAKSPSYAWPINVTLVIYLIKIHN